MYSYSGWNAATYIVGEVRDPGPQSAARAVHRNRDRHCALCRLNAVFLITTPMQELAGQLDVAIIAGKHMFGEHRRPHRRRR